MNRRLLLSTVLALAAVVACVRASSTSTPPGPTPVGSAAPDAGAQVAFCATGDASSLCPFMPHDVSSPLAGYSGFSNDGQRPFDQFSWQSLVALNWPANPDGGPAVDQPFNADPSVKRVWEYYKSPSVVFLPDGGAPNPSYPSPDAPPDVCRLAAASVNAAPALPIRMLTKLDDAANFPDDINEAAVNLPLIDKNLNYTVYEVLMNRDEFQYILDAGLYHQAGQNQRRVDFPSGHYADTRHNVGGPEGAIELKLSWRILDPTKGDDASRYFTRLGQIVVPARHSATGKPFCTPPVTLGLVGMHILHKTAHEQFWVWSTFEHEDNAPTTPTPEDQPGCALPSTGQQYSFFTPGCTQADGGACAPNAPPVTLDGGFTWQPKPPYARDFATAGKFGTQVVRCRPVYDMATQMSTVWRKKLAGTPWAHYHLVGTQWAVKTDGTPLPDGGPPPKVIPTYLGNTTAETYLQKGTSVLGFESSCIGCHQFATTADGGMHADFSFLLERAR
jgi:hypothetical protein